MDDEHSTGEPSREPVARKAYYSIGEVCELTGLKPHVLRYWETQFRILQPGKNRAGNRVYRPREIKVIVLLKHLLYTRKFTIEGAKQRLEELREEGTLEDRSGSALSSDFLEQLRGDLAELRELLTPPPAHRGPAPELSQPEA